MSHQQDLLGGQALQGVEAEVQVPPPETLVPPVHLGWVAGASCRETETSA